MTFSKTLLPQVILSKLTVILFICIFLINFFLIQGIPFFMYGHDDFSMAWTAKNASWSTLLKGLFFERVSIGENMYFHLGGRSTYFIFYKILMIFDGMQYPGLNFFFRIILFSSNSVLLFYLLKQLQVNQPLSFSGALIYGTAVPTYSILNFVGDLTVYSHFFMLLTFYIYLAKYREQQKTNPLLLSILLFFTSLLAIKSKQIAIIIPPVLLLHSIISKRNIRGTLKRTIPLFSILLLFYLPTSFSSNGASFTDLLFQFQTYYFYNPATRIGTGEAFALTNPVTSYLTTPGSLFGVYKFFLGWLTLLALIIFSILLCKNYIKIRTIIHWPQFSFILLWHISEITLMTAYFQEHLFEAVRYIGIAVPSFIALTLFSLQQNITYLKNPSVKKIISVLFIISLTLTIASNYYSSAIEIRGGLISRHTLIHDSIYVVYKDYFKKEHIDDTIFFKIFHWMDSRDEEEQLSKITFTELATEFGTPYNQKDIEPINQKLREKEFVYLLTFNKNISFEHTHLLRTLPACSTHSSIYCYLKDKIKGQNTFFYVYRVYNEKNNI